MIKKFDKFINEDFTSNMTKYSFEDFIDALHYMQEWYEEDGSYPNWGETEWTENEDFREDLMAGADDATVNLLDEIYNLYFKKR